MSLWTILVQQQCHFNAIFQMHSDTTAFYHALIFTINVSLFYLTKYSLLSLLLCVNVSFLFGWHSVHSHVFVIYEFDDSQLY